MWIDHGIDENYDDFQEIAVSCSHKNHIKFAVKNMCFQVKA